MHGTYNVKISYDIQAAISSQLTLTPLTWTIWRVPTNASKWRMGFNSAFKGLILHIKLDKMLSLYNSPFVSDCLMTAVFIGEPETCSLVISNLLYEDFCPTIPSLPYMSGPFLSHYGTITA